jgi:penicillin-insensitive murein endopeptidase
VSVRRHRNRYFGHPRTLALIKDLGAALSRRTDRLILVGDLSQPRGGLMSSSHRSHQNGLDVDIWFRLARSVSAANRDMPEGRDPPSILSDDGLAFNDGWGDAQRFLLKRAAMDVRVDRIFINPGIKRALCESETGARAWLRKLRPWWGHDAHFHVRLKCPPGDLDCAQQAPIPTGDGCGRALAWWFSPEARSPSRKRPAGSKPRPPMPGACRALLSGG